MLLKLKCPALQSTEAPTLVAEGGAQDGFVSWSFLVLTKDELDPVFSQQRGHRDPEHRGVGVA